MCYYDSVFNFRITNQDVCGGCHYASKVEGSQCAILLSDRQETLSSCFFCLQYLSAC